MSSLSTPSRLLSADVLRVGTAGLRTRPLRVFLSALGIAIGIAAMVCVVGVAGSSQAGLDRQLAALGTNLLRVAPGHDIQGQAAFLPPEAIPMIGRIGPVTAVSATAELTASHVYATDKVPADQTGNLRVLAADLRLLSTVRAGVAQGAWLNEATAKFPVTVLGATAAQRLNVVTVSSRTQVWLGGRWFTVAGVLEPAALAPELDYAALVGWPMARTGMGFDGHPGVVYARTEPDAVRDVQAVLARTANPAAPSEVEVSRPSEALTAQEATDTTLDALLLGLGGIALLVGGVGVANTMVISVLERRSEVGLRRALGATRGHIRLQFLAESLLLSCLGGVGGAVLGIAVTTAYATSQGWPIAVPVWATAGGVGITLVVGVIAGAYPAWRAARLSPTEALTAP
ncbi:ABC transporter permease [Hamadaea tsunoensis]|uniref:ABC transporter permease n=1 Tax=Hamadaea tsunoensis TaxID=53368 RepID=UPI000410CDC9|nr:ABC transporter permease [Hamadaea tsunoensis]